jgi:DNA transposition AAA+ family ATPase
MCSVAYPEDREKPSEESLISRLTRFIDESDLSFYQIASLIGTSGTILSMWLAGTAKPGTAEVAEIERFLKR